MSERALVRIILQSLWPSGLHPQRLEGRFRGDELIYARAADMELEWSCGAKENGACFEHRIVASICARRGMPEPSIPEASEEPEVEGQVLHRGRHVPSHSRKIAAGA